MKKTYLIELLSKLPSRQMKELSDFVKSPFFNKNESAEKLFEYLRLNHPEFKPAKIEKEFLYHKLFSPGEYNDSFMRMVIFKLTELAEQYLTYIDMTKEKSVPSLHLISSLLELGLDKSAQKIINSTEKDLVSKQIENEIFFKNKFEIEKYKHILYSRSYKPVTIKDKPDEKLLEISNNLTAYFLISILQRYRYLLNKAFTVNSDYEIEFLPYIKKFLEQEGKKYLKIKLVSMLLKQITLLQDISRVDIFTELKEELCDDKIAIEDSERRDGLTVLANICIEKGYSGKEEFFQHMLEIDKYLISKNLYKRIQGGYFQDEVFMNIVTIGLRQGDIEWTRQFIEEYYKTLAPETRENLYNFTYSKVYFKTRDLEKAKQYISRVKYSDLHMKINARITSIMIDYEMGNIEEVLMQIETFRKYIQKDKLLSKGHKKICANFVKFTAALSKARYQARANLKALKNEIEKCDMVGSRKWLIDKSNELMKRKS